MPNIKIGFLTITIFDIIDIILVTWIFYKVSVNTTILVNI